MPENVLSAIDVPCSLFGGLNTELSPPDIPEGVSPDNRDVAFLPGNVQPRPRLVKQLVEHPIGDRSIVYEKTFIQPDGTPVNLFLDSDGVLWQENVATSANSVTQIADIAAPRTYAQSITAFNREYIACSDGLHGHDVPRQYDGTNLDRVTQDGPGAGPLASAETSATVSITSIAPVVAGVGVVSVVENQTLVTVTCTTPHGMFPGDSVIVSTSEPDYNNNGQPIVVELSTSATFSYTVGTPGLQELTTGSVFPLKVEVTTASPHGLLLFDGFVVAGNSGARYNNNNVTGTTVSPSYWTVTNVIDPTHFTFTAASTADGSGTGGTLTVGGQIAAGPHKVVLLWQTRNGGITAPCPPFTFNASGQQQVTFSQLPVPPSNIEQGILAFTLSQGDNYFYIPVPAQGAGVDGSIQDISTSTVFPASATSVTFDFSDTSLAGGIAIDIPGNNLFAQVVLAPCLGFFSYASRLFAWGEWNNVKNLLNMGWDGGTTSGTQFPTGWNPPTDGAGSVIPGGYTVGEYQIVGNTSTLGGMISQTAYQDPFGIAIVQPNKKYIVRIVASRVVGSTGTLSVDLYSPSTGFRSLAQWPVTQIVQPGEVRDGWLQFNLTTPTPAAIPPDLVLRVYAQMPVGSRIVLDELMLIYAEKPWNDTTMRVSYVNNPEGFDGVTGVLGSASDTSPLRCCSTIRDFLYLKTTSGFHRTQDNGSGEPATWTVSEVSRRVGAVSFRAGDPGQYGTGDTGEGWDLTFSRSGLYIFSGGELYKISQEVQNIVDDINWTVAHTIWLKNDTVARRCYIGVPYQGATAPNIVLVMDYREMDTASNISQGSPVHISFTGKMISSDLTRKWTVWSLAMNCGELLVRPNNEVQFCMGCGNGVTPGAEPSFGNFYSLETMDSGGGTVTITPLMDSLTNPWPALPSIDFQTDMGYDLEWPLNVSTERCAFKIALTNVGSDDDYGPILPYYITYFFLNHEAEIALGTGTHRKLFYYLTLYISGNGSIQKLIVAIKQHPMSPIRGIL